VCARPDWVSRSKNRPRWHAFCMPQSGHGWHAFCMHKKMLCVGKIFFLPKIRSALRGSQRRSERAQGEAMPSHHRALRIAHKGLQGLTEHRHPSVRPDTRARDPIQKNVNITRKKGVDRIGRFAIIDPCSTTSPRETKNGKFHQRCSRRALRANQRSR
jgi:hypothetical protein